MGTSKPEVTKKEAWQKQDDTQQTSKKQKTEKGYVSTAVGVRSAVTPATAESKLTSTPPSSPSSYAAIPGSLGIVLTAAPTTMEVDRLVSELKTTSVADKKETHTVSANEKFKRLNVFSDDHIP